MGRLQTITVLTFWPLVAILLSYTFSITSFFSSIVFFGIPAAILSIQKPYLVIRSLFIATCIIPLMIVVDYIAEINQTWIWPLHSSIAPYRIFGVVSIEVLLWAFLHVYFAIIAYQYFFGGSFKQQFWNKRSQQAIWGTIGVFMIFIVLSFLLPSHLHIPYWYFNFGIIGILPVVILQAIRYPITFFKLFKIALYFFYLNFTYEITALKLGWWSFPGTQYIGHVSFFGVTFPFEEFFFWIMLFSLAILSYYEYFFNGER